MTAGEKMQHFRFWIADFGLGVGNFRIWIEDFRLVIFESFVSDCEIFQLGSDC